MFSNSFTFWLENQALLVVYNCFVGVSIHSPNRYIVVECVLILSFGYRMTWPDFQKGIVYFGKKS